MKQRTTSQIAPKAEAENYTFWAGMMVKKGKNEGRDEMNKTVISFNRKRDGYTQWRDFSYSRGLKLNQKARM